MNKYTRRPFAMGNTANPVVVIPELRGSLLKNSSGEFAGLPLPSELAIETEEGSTAGGVSVVFSTATTMTQVLADIAGTAGLVGFVTAEEVEGCLVLKSVGSGEGAYIRVMPPVSGFDDASAVFGFDVHPHPLATVSAGDLLDAPARPRQQVNPVGTKFIATGEDRVGAAYNRALQMLALNADTLYTWLQRSVARPVRLTISTADHAAYMVTNVDGSIAQLDLSNLAAFDATLADVRLCVGGSIGLSRDSSLREISELYEVTDSELKEIPAQDRIVRVGAVTRGQRTAVLPTFTDEISAPSTPVPNTYRTSVDGGNALGVDRAKHAGVTISEIRQRTTIVCTGATFITSGVTAGDVATITGAAVSSPFNHDGSYLVETVVSEEELVLRPTDTSETCRELNPSVGAFGSVVITSGGEWERSLWVSFYPPMPRMPEGGSFVLVVPVEAALGATALADIAKGSTRTNNNVAGWAVLNLWRGLTLSGLYQGMAGQNGSGFFGAITHRPLRLDRQTTATTAAGTTARSSTGTATLDLHTLRLTAAADDRFDTADVGLTILLTTPASVFYADEPWTVVRLIDNSTVELAPPIFRAGYQEADGSTLPITSWRLVEGDAIDLHGAMHVVSPEYFGDGDDAPAEGGYIFSREQRDEATTDPPVPGFFSFLHLERVRLTASGTNITVTTAGPLSADDVLPLSFAPESTSNIFGESYETKTGALQSSLTFVRLLNGKNAGLYRVKDVKDASVSVDAVTVQRLDGTPVVFTAETEVQVCFYNAKVGASVPLHGGPGAATTFSAALSLFADAKETDHVADYGLRLGWRGVGGGIIAYVNDPEFSGYDNGDGGDGPLITAILHAPADGIDLKVSGADSGAPARRSSFGFRIRAHTNRHDYALSNPGPSGPLFHSNSSASFGGYIGQTGKDPALVIVKHDAAEAGDETTQRSKLSPSAALLVGRAEASSTDDLSGPAGRGSALEVAGSIYVYRHTAASGNNPAWSEGGVFVEDVLGAGRWLYPTAGVYDFEASPYSGTGTLSGWEAPTQLGNAGQVYPPSVEDAAVSAELLAPDYTIFNYPHSGIVHIADVGAMTPPLNAPFNRFVGCRFKLDDPAADLDQAEFAIIGTVMSAQDRLYLALHSETATIDVDAGQVLEFKILGQRWHRAYLNIADYAMIGTYDGDAPLSTLPLLTADLDVLSTRTTAAPDATQLPSLGMLSYAPWAAATTGVSIGSAAADTSDMPNVYVTNTTFQAAAGWSGDAESLYYSHGWSTDAGEPRPPFPNAELFASPDADDSAVTILTAAGYQGSFATDDYVATFVSGSGRLSWSSGWGGSLRIAGLGAATVRVLQRGRTYALSAHLGVRVQLRAAITLSGGGTGADRTFTFTLRTASDDVLATATAVLTVDGTPHDLIVELTRNELGDEAADALGGSKLLESLHVAVSVDVASSGEAISILEFRTESTTRAAVVDGPQVVAGTLLAHGFRFTDPIQGYETKGPASAHLLGGLDYARNESWPTYDGGSAGWETSSVTGTQELRCGPGLVRMRSDAQYLSWQIALTLLANALGAGDIDSWMAALSFAAQYGYYGGTATSVDPEADAVAAKCAATIAESNFTDKVALAEEAAALGKILANAIRARFESMDDGTNSGAASTRSELSSYRALVEDALAFTLPDTAEYAALLSNEPKPNWIRPWVDYHRLFSRGVHSAAITLYNGAFDPLWYARQADLIYNATGTSTTRLHQDAFVPCGTTGFLIPVEPPHGAVLTSLSIGLSFRAHSSGRWGIYFGMVDSLAALGQASSPLSDYVDIAHDTEWEDQQGVSVELWRHNTVDFDVDEPELASWSSHLPEFGFGERLAQWTIDLSTVTPPSDEANPVTAAWTQPSLGGAYGRDVYAGKEHFERRTWNLTETFGGASPRARVDRRHYTYMVVVRFFGGMRYTALGGVDMPYVRGDKTANGTKAPDSRWEIPQKILRTAGTSDGEFVEGQIYGTFDAAYNVDGKEDMNTPWQDMSFPPQVKFRGLRLGWLTDRAGNGGW